MKVLIVGIYFRTSVAPGNSSRWNLAPITVEKPFFLILLKSLSDRMSLRDLSLWADCQLNFPLLSLLMNGWARLWGRRDFNWDVPLDLHESSFKTSVLGCENKDKDSGLEPNMGDFVHRYSGINHPKLVSWLLQNCFWLSCELWLEVKTLNLAVDLAIYIAWGIF